jgi:arabinogalactan oligomer/maltooligosaccharide transport system substrate-binding protein
MKVRRRFAALLAVAVAVTVSAVAGGSAAAAPAAGASHEAAATKVRIWADRDRQAAVQTIAGAWGRERGVEVDVVLKDFGKIRDDLKTVQPDQAPDVIVGAHDWVGQLAADGSIVPLFPTRATRAQFPPYALESFSYGTAIKRLFGAPVALENVGLVINTRLGKVPKTFNQLYAMVLAFKKKSSANIGLAVPQGANGDAYHMYPLFSGLGGYVFGKNRAGNLDPSDIGLDNPIFLRNSRQIDQWNKTGFIRSTVDYNTAKDKFLKGQAVAWITGPWESDTLKKSGLRFRIIQVPAIAKKSVPFLGVQGFMVTKFAGQHGVETSAKDLVGNFMMRADSQVALAAANGRYPANTTAGRRVNDPVLKQFGAAGAGGVPMPNIPQMAAVWSELGGAWVKSTKGAGALRARTAFNKAAQNIALKIG